MKKLFFMCCLLLAFNVSVKAQTTKEDDKSSKVELSEVLALDDVTASITNEINDLKQVIVQDVSSIIKSQISEEGESFADTYKRLSSSFINDTTTEITKAKQQIKEGYYPSINKLLSYSTGNNSNDNATQEITHDSMNKLLSCNSLDK